LLAPVFASAWNTPGHMLSAAIATIEGKLFESKQQTEQHGVELCKEWIE
jgi:hypothetical protein